MTPGPDPYAADSSGRKKTILLSIAGALAVGVLAGIGGMRLLDASRNSPGPVLAKKGAAPAPALAQVANTPPPALERTDTAPASKTMPADVRAWLEHLERIERKRGELANKDIARLRTMGAGIKGGGADIQALKDFANAADDPMNAPDPKSPAEPVAGLTGEARQEWSALQSEYDTVAVPAPCRTLGNTYRSALRETGAQLTDVMDRIDQATQTGDVSKLQELLDKKSDTAIDRYGSDSDSELGRICASFDTRKWFSISSDFGGQGLLDKF